MRHRGFTASSLGLLAVWIALSAPDCGSSSTSERRDWKGVPHRARAVGDSLFVLLARETRIAPRRSRGEVNAIYLKCPRPAARFELDWVKDTLAGRDPFEVIDRELPRRGWIRDPRRADGPDGAVYAFRRGPLLCIVESAWETNATSDSSAAPPRMSMLVDVAEAKPCPKGPVPERE